MDSRHGFEKVLADLQRFDADPARIERIRARCLHALEAQNRRKGMLPESFVQWRRRIELAAAFGLSAVYLAAAVARGLALFR